jgi:hypothetical protein
MMLKMSMCLSEHTNVYAVTIPKAGTNLLAKALRLLTHRESKRYSSPELLKGQLPEVSDQILFSHLPFDKSAARLLKKYHYKCLFMIRDPRDVVVSNTHWLVTQPLIHQANVKKHAEDPAFFSKLLTQQIEEIKKTFDNYVPWMNDEAFYTVRFENLVGAQGGGSNKKQKQELKNIAAHSGIDLSSNELRTVAAQLFGGTMTFREGQTSSWKKHFDADQKKLFKKVAGKLLIDLGYEQDFDW